MSSRAKRRISWTSTYMFSRFFGQSPQQPVFVAKAPLNDKYSTKKTTNIWNSNCNLWAYLAYQPNALSS